MLESCRPALRCGGALSVAAVQQPPTTLEREEAEGEQRDQRDCAELDVGDLEHDQRADDQDDVDCVLGKVVCHWGLPGYVCVYTCLPLDATRVYTRVMTSGAPAWGRARRTSGRDETRTAILDTALRLFDERGYVGVRVEDIAQEAGVSRATFYKHFAEREQILGELFERLIGGSVPPEVAPPAAEDIEQHVLGVLAACMERMLEDERLARFVYSLPIRHDAVLPGGSAVPAVFAQVQGCLTEGVGAGRVRSDIPVERMVEVLGRTFEASMRAWADGTVSDPRERLGELARIVFGGITTAGRSTG